MKAETILKLIERAREPMLKEAHLKAYAKDQIQKDRERVNKNINPKWPNTSIDNTPIILE